MTDAPMESAIQAAEARLSQGQAMLAALHYALLGPIGLALVVMMWHPCPDQRNR